MSCVLAGSQGRGSDSAAAARYFGASDLGGAGRDGGKSQLTYIYAPVGSVASPNRRVRVWQWDVGALARLGGSQLNRTAPRLSQALGRVAQLLPLFLSLG